MSLISRLSSLFESSAKPVQPAAIPDSLRVLIVDDEADVRDLLNRLLTARGHETFVAESGAAALPLLRRLRFDVMLCDIKMETMSGLELLPQAMTIDPSLAVVMLTGMNDVSTASAAVAGGALDYLVKPVEMKDLERAIKRAADRRRLEKEQRRTNARAAMSSKR
jgi:DNA-binding NtrC family response regulator